MRRLLIILALLAPAWCFYPMQPAAAASACPSEAVMLLRVVRLWQGYHGGWNVSYYKPVASREFASLVALPSLFAGAMQAVYTPGVDDPDYWLLDDGRAYFATEQAYPFLVEYYVGKYGRSTCQLLIGTSPEYPDLAFVYEFTDYWSQLNDGDSAVHPGGGAFYMRRADLVALVGAWQ